MAEQIQILCHVKKKIYNESMKYTRHRKIQISLLPLNPLECAACHVNNASCWTGHYTDKPLPNSFEEASCTFLFGTLMY